MDHFVTAHPAPAEGEHPEPALRLEHATVAVPLQGLRLDRGARELHIPHVHLAVRVPEILEALEELRAVNPSLRQVVLVHESGERPSYIEPRMRAVIAGRSTGKEERELDDFREDRYFVVLAEGLRRLSDRLDITYVASDLEQDADRLEFARRNRSLFQDRFALEEALRDPSPQGEASAVRRLLRDAAGRELNALAELKSERRNETLVGAVENARRLVDELQEGSAVAVALYGGAHFEVLDERLKVADHVAVRPVGLPSAFLARLPADDSLRFTPPTPYSCMLLPSNGRASDQELDRMVLERATSSVVLGDILVPAFQYREERDLVQYMTTLAVLMADEEVVDDLLSAALERRERLDPRSELPTVLRAFEFVLAERGVDVGGFVERVEAMREGRGASSWNSLFGASAS